MPSAVSAWMRKVNWQKGDALEPESYKHLLGTTTAVVHAVGTLLEDQTYKSYIKPSASTSGASKNVKYEVVNRDTADKAAAAASEHKNVETFVYISADSAPPFVDKRYISTKREAEQLIKAHPEYKTVILRPGFLFDDSDMTTSAMALGIKSLGCISSRLGVARTLTPPPPVSVSILAQATVQAVLKGDCEGTFGPEDIPKLAQQAN
ncbi:hypothetical protein SARC_10244 [Sphaeroforma arctica JP610]|uniref:NAD(P)-binding domain-containing protein n=1 Tax=Sphaeroforma arctica JP610 TaxID=667725 RepID=A0A0L0FMN5_9EUKA|nr:hypothetical protein SARC_10244 [Sphaeroforma arctica JP610]KNC77293.1 hypothetical protein SARC_10244 [Sphaeroforma arctica JP610]|eukprot:XP_014151195.1 hypothetical protein SARC_10244 [Sphaeroforma arctica JP610]